MKLAIALLALVMTGCATAPETTSMLLDAQVKLASKDTLSIDCPAGCKVSYTDPRDRAFKMPTNGFDVANTFINRASDVVQGAVIPATFGWVATEGFKAMRGHGTTTTSTDSHNTDSHNTADSNNLTDRHDTTTDSNDVDSTHTPTVVNPVVVNPVVIP